MKALRRNISLILTLVLMFSLISITGIESYADGLDTPINLRWEGTYAVWDAVEGATEYYVNFYKDGELIKNKVTFDGNEYDIALLETTDTEKINVYNILSTYGDGKYTFTVCAIKKDEDNNVIAQSGFDNTSPEKNVNNNIENSDYSNLKWDGTNAVWDCSIEDDDITYSITFKKDGESPSDSMEMMQKGFWNISKNEKKLNANTVLGNGPGVYTFTVSAMNLNSNKSYTQSHKSPEFINPACKVTFDANGGSGSMSSVEIGAYGNYTLPEASFTAPANKAFDKWEIIDNKTKKTINSGMANEIIAFSGSSTDITIKAIWKDGAAEVEQPDPGIIDDPYIEESEIDIQEIAKQTDGKVTIVSWNEEFKTRVDSLIEIYPELKDKVYCINFGVSGTGDEYIEEINLLANAAKNTTIILAVDSDLVAKAYKSINLNTLSDIGFSEADYKKSAYAYAVNRGTNNDKLYLAAYDLCPGAVIYRKDIAKSVFGTDDSAKIQEYLKDWDTFLESAKTVKQAGYGMLSGTDHIMYAYYGAKDLSESNSDYDAYVKKIEPYTNGNEGYSEAWVKDMNGNVFAWFGCTWFDKWVFESDSKIGICEGPAGYVWGGTYIGVIDKGSCEADAAKILNLLCMDEAYQTKLFKNGSYPNNKSLIEDLIKNNTSFDGAEKLYEQNPIPVWHENLLKLGNEASKEESKQEVVKPVDKEEGDKFSTYQGCEFFKEESGDVRCYDSNGNAVIDEFKCDGEFTYYFQADGTAMKDRLTYHPDGVHVIYFDENGHEVFNDFSHVKKSIAGEEVDDYCFFDVFGHLYVDVITWDKTGTTLYYANPYGVLEMGKWFQFSDNVKWGDGTECDGIAGGYGYATDDGTLMKDQYTYDWEGRFCYMQGNGVALY